MFICFIPPYPFTNILWIVLDAFLIKIAFSPIYQIFCVCINGWLVVFNVPSTARSQQRRHPHLLSFAKKVKPGFYTVPTGNQTPDRRVAVHYTTTSPSLLHHA